MKITSACAVVVIGLVMLAGCDSEGDDDPDQPSPATTILDVRVEPNPVMLGDTTTITCVITDSMDTDLEFWWMILGGFGPAVTDTNTYRWVADLEPHTYLNYVVVFRPPVTVYEPVSDTFFIEVIAPE